MLILLSCAKTMGKITSRELPFVTQPLFPTEAADIAAQLSLFSVGELEEILHVNPKIALDNYRRYQNFHSPDQSSWPALLSYTGIVFKRLNPKDFTGEDYRYAQEHLRFTSFCYGLLRPLDGIQPYRLEGEVKIPDWGDLTLFDYWKDKLTDHFIEEINRQGGILLNLASGEMKNLFHWKKVREHVRVITPEFLSWKNEKLKTIVIYTKMCRGEMARYVLKNRIEDPEELKRFSWEGYEYDEESSEKDRWIFHP